MAQKKRKMWTVCYILYRPEDDDPDNWYSNSWFAFGATKEEAIFGVAVSVEAWDVSIEEPT